ncbi:hypothetical protein [Azonexus sp. R2A61]|uniref:hypothetical protein n=1 Tax=Azonexus sp. R2A61 TaxID=2744443 RepID=UPI001F161120|nr:hypothetical protein [Azonexus sp. R2A61]
MEEKEKKTLPEFYKRKPARTKRIEVLLSQDEFELLQFHLQKKLYAGNKSGRPDFFRACIQNPIEPEIHNYKIRLLKELNKIGVNLNQGVKALHILNHKLNDSPYKPEHHQALIDATKSLIAIEQAIKELRK